MTGKLTIILGYAAGVGKTYRMMQEGQHLKAEGRDVVIGYFEPHARPETIAQTVGLEMVPRRVIEYRKRQFEEMDTAAIVARKPAVCLVDEFPHTNIPGAERSKRWEDVLYLLDQGIDVITTMNIQHLESLNDQVREMAGVEVRETIPDWVVKRASDVILVDLTPGALLNRLDRGVVYAPEKAELAKANFFKAPTLAALRELALRQTAHEVDIRQPEAEPHAQHSERILILITDSPAAAALIRRARRVADYLRAECFAVAIDGMSTDAAALERHLTFARRLQIETHVLSATRDEAPEALVGFARERVITQIFLEKPEGKQTSSFAMRVIRQVRDVQVTLVA